MPTPDEIKLIWWEVMDAHGYLGNIGELPYIGMADRIMDIQFDLWDICKIGVSPRPFRYNNGPHEKT